jgi:hypothetical protein
MPQVKKTRIVKYTTEARASVTDNVIYALVFGTVAMITVYIVIVVCLAVSG